MTGTDAELLARAVALARRCPASTTAYAVGALVVAPDGTELGRGHSRETASDVHAEEVALERAGAAAAGATVYSSLEPCAVRRSRPVPCAPLLVAAGVRRVVFALREPPLLAEGGGAEVLAAAGVEVVELPELAGAARAANPHLLD
ncbi:MAG TPA: dCMP deaminase [Mycobacteriales bacterium]|nr:dCMP deaminase [Mycobacteriales bacterium]